MRFPPAIVNLRRAQLALMLAVLIPTVAMAAVGIVLIALGNAMPTVLAAVLILTLCTTGITGYILGSIFVGKGASFAQLQNDFLGSVSHELRTPLTSMNLLLESLRGGRLAAEDTERVIALLNQETARLEQLVNRLIELTRLETGGHVFARETIDVAGMVAEAVASFDMTSMPRPTPVAVSIEPGLTVVGDRATLVRAIVNLLTNAWKYTDDDKRISVTAIASKRWVEIAVTDNGIGMSKAEQRLAFTRFARGRKAVDRKTPGVGLGLAFVRAIVRGHDGRMAITSTVGRGTTMTIKLKRRRKPRVAPVRTAPAPAAQQAAAH
jgi:two-component system, OmpR family, phosphate regulon sensor histidine kinase PhoR